MVYIVIVFEIVCLKLFQNSYATLFYSGALSPAIDMQKVLCTCSRERDGERENPQSQMRRVYMS